MESRPAAPSSATGFAALDAALGIGGLPRGRIVELFGPPSSGKTTLALQIVAHCSKNGATAAWIDAEHVFDPAYAAALGVAVEALAAGAARIRPSRRWRSRANWPRPARWICWWSIPRRRWFRRLELETGIGESGPGCRAACWRPGCAGWPRRSRRTGRRRAVPQPDALRMEPSGGERETSAGGPPLKLYAAVRIALGPAAGRRVRFRILKNKAAAAFAEGELGWNRARDSRKARKTALSARLTAKKPRKTGLFCA